MINNKNMDNLKYFLSESGYPGLRDLQDVVVLLSMINRDCGNI